MLPKLGRTTCSTPNIDALCAEGVTFRNHFTQAVPCGPGAGEPADRALHDEPSGGAEHHAAGCALHQPGARDAPRRLRSGAGRLHHDHARPARHPAQRPALPRAGRHHGGLAPGRRLGNPRRRLFQLARAARAFKLPESREDIWLPAGAAAAPGATTLGLADSQGAVGHRLVHRARPHLPARHARPAVVPASRLLPPASAVHRAGALQRDVRSGDMPQARARAPRRREAQQHPLLAYYMSIKQSSSSRTARGSARR